MNFENLIPVTNVNTRVNYDLKYSGTTGKFNLSASAFSRLDLNNNGFILFRSPDNTAVLQIVPNEKADLYKGREGSNKSLSFTANTLAEILDLEKDAEFTFKQHNANGNIYLTLETEAERTEDVNSVEELEETFDTITAEENSDSIVKEETINL